MQMMGPWVVSSIHMIPSQIVPIVFILGVWRMADAIHIIHGHMGLELKAKASAPNAL
jgi:hypothetical protein